MAAASKKLNYSGIITDRRNSSIAPDASYNDEYRMDSKRRDMSPMGDYEIYTNNPLGSAKVEKSQMSHLKRRPQADNSTNDESLPMISKAKMPPLPPSVGKESSHLRAHQIGT